MTDWDNISEEEGKKKYASMMLNLVSFVEAGELDEFVEQDIEKLKRALKLVEEFTKKLEKDGVILEINGTEVSWKWNKWWDKK
mgnify:CR=1 FL=1